MFISSVINENVDVFRRILINIDELRRDKQSVEKTSKSNIGHLLSVVEGRNIFSKVCISHSLLNKALI